MLHYLIAKGGAHHLKKVNKKKTQSCTMETAYQYVKTYNCFIQKNTFIPFYTLLKIKKYSAVKSINKMGSLISIDMGRVVYKIWY